MSYPYIYHFNDQISNHLVDAPQFKVMQREGYFVVDYMYADSHTFDDPMLLECRGIAFRNNGEILSRPLHKFFNLGEKEHLALSNFDQDNIYDVYDKLDGSMIAVSYNIDTDDLLVKTRATDDNFQSIEAVKILKSTGVYDKLLNSLRDNYNNAFVTLIFEYTSPDNMVVVHYLDSKMTLLACRCNLRGSYIDFDTHPIINKEWLRDIGIELVNHEKRTLRDVLDKIVDEQDSEGYVVRKGDIWFKIKNDWYVGLHKAISMLRYRDVVELFLDSNLDDFKSKLIMNNVDTRRIVDIEHDMIAQIDDILNFIRDTVNQCTSRGYSFKDVALMYKHHELFGLIMRAYRGQDIDVMEWYRRNKLKKWSLDQIGITYIKEK